MKILFSIFATALAIPSIGKSLPPGFVQPASWVRPAEVIGSFNTGKDDPDPIDVRLHDDGEIKWLTPDGNVPSKLQAKEIAIQALTEAWRAQKLALTLADTVFEHAVLDLKIEETEDGSTKITWSVAGKNGGKDSKGHTVKRLKADEKTITEYSDTLALKPIRGGPYCWSEEGWVEATNITATLKTDESSVEFVGEAKEKKLQLLGFAENKDRTGDSIFIDSAGKINYDAPFFQEDDNSIEIDKNDNYRPTALHGKHGFHIFGWYSPDSDSNKCEDTIAMHLTNSVPDKSHYVLTRYNDEGTPRMHYMRIGNLGNVKSSTALQVIGTAGGGVTVGSGSTTNTIKFVSSPGVKVMATQSEVENGIDVTVSVGWAWED